MGLHDYNNVYKQSILPHPACHARFAEAGGKLDAYGLGLQVPLPESVKFPEAMGTNSH